MNKHNIKISIIIPCYNDGKCILEAIESAEKYKGSDAEIIIVNDGSTDDYTISIFKELKQKGYFVIEQENLGLSSARNNAIKQAKGKYILPLDSDNMIKPEYISKSMKILDEHPEIGIVYSDVEFFGEKNGVHNVAEFDISRLLVSNYIDACAVFRKQVWIDVKGYDENLNKLFWEDWEFWLNAHKKGWKFHHIQEVLFHYRKKNESLALRALIPEEKKKAHNHILFGKHSDLFYEDYKQLVLSDYISKNKQLKKRLSAKDFIIREKKEIIQEKNDLIHKQRVAISALQNWQNSVKQSITWNILSKMHKVTGFFFPLGTKRRKNFDLALIGTQVLFCEGWKSFLARYKAYKLYCKGIKPDDKKYYFQWVEEEKKNNLNVIKKEIETFEYKPIISIIMPTWNTADKILQAAIESVQAQIYPYWELCIADGNSKSETKQILTKFAQKDERIKIKYLNKNLNISENSNQAIKLAGGEFIGLLDHDDELTFDALYEVVKLLQEHPDADLIYSDEDKIDEKGKRSSFFFKPDWSPDLLLSQNYISHFGVYRKSIVDKISGFRIGYEGSQDYDLVIRFTEQTNQIYHIPRILYHWRMIDGSVAIDPNAKQYAYDCAKRALADAMDRRNISYSDIEMNFKGGYRIRYEVLEEDTVTIIIPTKDRSDLLEKCINSILEKTDYINYEILIVNNRSKEKQTLKYLQTINKNSKINVIDFEDEFNFSAINNYAVKLAKGKYLLFLNNDIEILSRGWINAMMEFCQKENVGAVGAKLLYPNNTIQHAGVFLGSEGNCLHAHKLLHDKNTGYYLRPHVAHNVSAVTGACLMIKKRHFLEVDGFDENNLKITYNDVDLCLKLQEKGYWNIYTPFAKLYHHESVSRGCKVTPSLQNELSYIKQKWQKIFAHDPFYNQNLIQNNEDYGLRY